MNRSIGSACESGVEGDGAVIVVGCICRTAQRGVGQRAVVEAFGTVGGQRDADPKGGHGV